jgi:glycosyltransferase involved in cell wall biosynthesis
LLPGRVVWSGEARRDLAKRLAETSPDVVHIHNTFPLLSASVLSACRDAGVPAVVTFHNYRLLCATGDFFRDGQPCHECSGRMGVPGILHGCYRGSRLATIPVVASNVVHREAWRSLVAAYIFISGSQRELMADLDLPRDRMFVKHNFVVDPPPVPRTPQHQVAFVGRLDAAKGIPLLLQGWDAFRARRPGSGLRLVVVGGGPMEDAVRAWAASRPSVEVTGLLPREEAVGVLAHSLGAVVTSQSEETFGLVAVEAMAAMVAPIAPARGSFPELVTHGVDGLLVQPGDPTALADALEEADRDPQRFVTMGRRARETYECRFRPETNVDQLLDIYRFAVSNPVGGLPVQPSPEPGPVVSGGAQP